jgi:hypothetical protein
MPLPTALPFCRSDWGDAAEVAAQVSDVKEGIYQRLTAGGIAAFPGVARLVEQVRPVVCLVLALLCAVLSVPTK